MRAPFSVRMHFSKLALRTRKGQPTTWPRRGGGRKKRFVAPFLTSYWSLRCLAAAAERIPRPSIRASPLRHLTRPLSRSLAYYKCTTTLNSLTPARHGAAGMARQRIAHSYDDDGCNCRRSRRRLRVRRRGVGIRGERRGTKKWQRGGTGKAPPGGRN